MNVVIYARYSDSKQTENSIEGQLRVCKEYIQKMGYTFLRAYCDRARTGRTDNREQFKLMLSHSAKKQFDRVIVYALDRFGRNILQGLLNEKLLNDNGVIVESATENFGNTPQGRMARNIQMSVAQYYTEELAQKVMRGLEDKSNQAIFLGGPIPLGYKVVDQHLVEDERTAPIVREIFRKYADGYTVTEICDNLNQRRICTSKGKPFNKNSFHTMLTNRRYLGIYIYGEKEIVGGIPQIIDQALFDKVAERMKLNKKAPGRARAKAEYLLTQKMYCGYCGEMMIGHSSNKVSKNGVIYNYYRCKNAGGRRPCKKKMIGKDYIEDVVVAECRKLLTENNISRIAKQVYAISRSMEDNSELVRLTSALDEKRQEAQNQMNSLRKCTDDMVKQMIFDDLKSIQLEVKSIEAQIDLEKARHFRITEKQIVAYLSKLAQGNVSDYAYRQALIRHFVNKVYLYDDKLTIIFNTGDEDATITDILLQKIEKTLGNESLCFLEVVAHQKKTHTIRCVSFFARTGIERPAEHSEAKKCPVDTSLGRGRFHWLTNAVRQDCGRKPIL